MPELTTIVQGLAGDLALQAFGPYQAGDAGTELVRVRRSAFCPAKYTALILEAPVTSRAAFELLYTQLTADNKLVECNLLVKFLQAALTQTTNNVPSPIAQVAPTAPLADGLLMSYRDVILKRDFPLLDRNLPQLQQHNIANQLSQLVANAKQHRTDALLQKQQDKVKSPESFFGATGVATLIRLARVADQDHLPPIYGRLASAAHHARLSELQWAIDIVKNRLGCVSVSQRHRHY